MRKLSVFFMGIMLSVAFTTSGLREVAVSAEEVSVYVGGMSAGFTLKTGGVQVIGLSEVVTEQGGVAPALQAGIKTGDLIQKAGGIRVETIADLNEIIEKSKGNDLELEVLRGGEGIKVTVKAGKEQGGRYKIGILVRESVSGIGTVTYIDKNGHFGALGHSVVGDNHQEMCISNGMVYECSIVGVTKGVRGRAGELRGMFLNDKEFGNAEKISHCGIFGQISGEFVVDELLSMVASSENAKPGNAYIYSTIDGTCPKRYQIEIVKVDKWNKEHKNYVIKVIDKELLEETGGIVQGMSGSPIVQEGKLVGAVTHVFLNAPTRGYGIDIKQMLNE